MTDIVKRLRAPVTVERNDGIRIEAADEIERLRRLVKAWETLSGIDGDPFRLLFPARGRVASRG